MAGCPGQLRSQETIRLLRRLMPFQNQKWSPKESAVGMVRVWLVFCRPCGTVSTVRCKRLRGTGAPGPKFFRILFLAGAPNHAPIDHFTKAVSTSSSFTDF